MAWYLWRSRSKLRDMLMLNTVYLSWRWTHFNHVFALFVAFYDYLNMFSKSLCLWSMLSFCISNCLAVESEIIVRMAQTIRMKTNAILKLPMLNRVLLRSYSEQSMGNCTRNALTSGERVNTRLQNPIHNTNYITLFSHGRIPFQTTRYTRFLWFL